MERTLKRKRASSGPSALLIVLLVTVVLAAIPVASGIVAGGAAGVVIASLDRGLPDIRSFTDLGFSQPTRILDSKGKIELARFWDERREVIAFEDIPPLVLDATTATEDTTFWSNPGVDLGATLNAFVTEAAGGGDRGGGSTITQQLVRARLLPPDVIANDGTAEGLYVRKAKEILQAYKLTQAFPGEEGKKAIITAYLNEISYGAALGIAAAADLYFGKPLEQLTASEAALLAAIPQTPSQLYPWKRDERTGRYLYLSKEKGKKTKSGKQHTRLILKTCVDKGPACQDSALVIRRDFILRRLAAGNGRWTSLSEEQLSAALEEKIVVKPPKA